ncbi:MAG: RelA/SpoT AH/RIS domain-containing protein, partial [Calditrichia bacterium]
PKKATPVDFAFAVHSNVGMHCIGAKVNGKIVPLKSELHSGDQVEIITSQNQHPTQDWMTFVKTGKARHHIRKYLREVQFEHSIKLGDEILTRNMKKFKIKLTNDKMTEIINQLHFEDQNNLMAAIGRGEVSIEKVLSVVSEEKLEEPRQTLIDKILWRGKHSAVRVDGVENMLVNIGKCCQPVPGDSIIGYITKGKGVTIHRSNCPNVQRLISRNDRSIQVNWTVEVEESFKVQLAILGEDRKNLLRDITHAISNQNTNILHVDLKAKDKLVTGKVIVEVKNLSHLTRIIQAIHKIKGILNVEREEKFVKRKVLQS